MENKITCQLCGLVCSMQISASHLRVAHNMTTKEYKALGYETLSPARRDQLANTPFAKGEVLGVRGKFGENHWHWKGGHVNSHGYKILSINGKPGIYEHRLIAERVLGRPLQKDEIVHHIDGNRLNNSPDNLVVMKVWEHDKLKEGVRAFSHTNKDCEEAAKTLLDFGWPKAKICLALRIHHATLERWLGD